MTEVTLVTRGEYADKRPLAVFTDPAAAERWAARWNSDHRDLLRGPSDWAAVDSTLPIDPAGVR
jgi:hypothetical protein